jgi:Lon protease-like protein
VATAAELPPVLPLFPLPDVVLFPHMPLPLHVFEPRYRKMVADALRGERVIGMTLLQPGWEADYDGRPAVFGAGCAGVIERCQPLPDGRYNIVLKGLKRFRIHEEHDGEPYRLATVMPLPEEPGSADALATARLRLVATLDRVGSALVVAPPELPHDLFVNALCQSLDLLPLEKQSLLEAETILERYERLEGLIEFHGLHRATGARGTVH